MAKLKNDNKEKLPIYYPIVITLLVIFITISGFLTIKKYIFKDPIVSMEETKLKTLGEAVTRNPDNVSVRLKLAYELQLLQDFDQAKKQYLEALKLAPEDLAANYNLGAIAVEQKNYDEAEKYFTQTLALEPNHVLAAYGLGQMYFTQKEFDKVVDTVDPLLKSNPENASLHSLKAKSLEKLGKIMEAKTEYSTVLKYIPDDKDTNEALKRLK